MGQRPIVAAAEAVPGPIAFAARSVTMECERYQTVQHAKEAIMGIFGPKRRSARADAERCRHCGSANIAVGYVDRVTVTVTRRCDDCATEWREPFVDLTAVGPVVSGRR